MHRLCGLRRVWREAGGAAVSHAATKWAFDQPETFRDMKPSEWAVLMVLADCHNPVNGCYPSQDYICSKTNLSDRAVRDQLVKLRERKLVAWDAAREDGRRASNRYSLAFEGDFQPANPAASQAADFAGSSGGKIEQEQPANSDTFNRQNLPPNPVREPVIEPSVEREARARAEENDPRPWENDEQFMRSAKAWGLLDSFAASWREWAPLEAAQRASAERKIPVYQALHAVRAKRIAFSTYLRERQFEHLPDPETKAISERHSIDCFVRDYWVIFHRRRLASPDAIDRSTRRPLRELARQMLSFTRQYRLGPSVELADMPTDAERAALVAVERGSDQFKAWVTALRVEGFSIADEEIAGNRVFMPSEWPQDDLKTARTG